MSRNVVDIYLHGDIGRASAWARRAQAGDPVGYAGPRTHWEPDPQAAWALLAAEETGLPALLAILESLPPGARAIARRSSRPRAIGSPVIVTRTGAPTDSARRS
jgi:NADPH-dependent ferric siderophore reductase